MLAFLVDVPSLIIFAVLGSIFGGAFGALGKLLEQKLGFKNGSLLAVLGVVLTFPVVDYVLIPKILNDKLNADLPKMIDGYTRIDRIEHDGRTVRYFFTILSSNFDNFDIAEAKKAGLPQMCDLWKPKLLNGEVIYAEYNYTFGTKKDRFTVALSDCV